VSRISDPCVKPALIISKNAQKHNLLWLFEPKALKKRNNRSFLLFKPFKDIIKLHITLAVSSAKA
jgi:hypothetical protein